MASIDTDVLAGNPAVLARAIAESLVPDDCRPDGWQARWDHLERWCAEDVSDDDLRNAYQASTSEAGDPEQDAIATALMVRNIDL